MRYLQSNPKSQPIIDFVSVLTKKPSPLAEYGGAFSGIYGASVFSQYFHLDTFWSLFDPECMELGTLQNNGKNSKSVALSC
ncbi:hypothetical protein ES705_19247 [subsurface metagenome]